MERSVVGARELKTRLGTYLRRVREGRTVLVTAERDRALASLADDFTALIIVELTRRLRRMRGHFCSTIAFPPATPCNLASCHFLQRR